MAWYPDKESLENFEANMRQWEEKYPITPEKAQKLIAEAQRFVDQLDSLLHKDKPRSDLQKIIANEADLLWPQAMSWRHLVAEYMKTKETFDFEEINQFGFFLCRSFDCISEAIKYHFIKMDWNLLTTINKTLITLIWMCIGGQSNENSYLKNLQRISNQIYLIEKSLYEVKTA